MWLARSGCSWPGPALAAFAGPPWKWVTTGRSVAEGVRALHFAKPFEETDALVSIFRRYMAPKNPQLGSLALQAPSSKPQVVHVTPATCQNLSLFKDILKEYRRLDDTIIMRLNRANAMARDDERERYGEGVDNAQTQACGAVFRELVENWKRRTKLVDYCVSVVDHSLEEKRAAIRNEAQDPASQRRAQAVIFAEEVQRNQVHNELSVESIVRKRVTDAFKSRCRYFVSPTVDKDVARTWESASGR